MRATRRCARSGGHRLLPYARTWRSANRWFPARAPKPGRPAQVRQLLQREGSSRPARPMRQALRPRRSAERATRTPVRPAALPTHPLGLRAPRPPAGARRRAGSPATSPAGAIAEHGVPHHPAAEPRRVHPGSDGGNGAGPFVPEADRIRRVAGVEIGHLAGEEFHVGAAETDPFYIDDDLTWRGNRGRHLLHRTLAG